ncbi:hypothetical protein T492DRAFT_1122153 [Pavlovales sp. CCMP2436]|nr:hypothetical protein T492DRAFT_1122153 [Pavlovales sp. CCMP2436]
MGGGGQMGTGCQLGAGGQTGANRAQQMVEMQHTKHKNAEIAGAIDSHIPATPPSPHFPPSSLPPPSPPTPQTYGDLNVLQQQQGPALLQSQQQHHNSVAGAAPSYAGSLGPGSSGGGSYVGSGGGSLGGGGGGSYVGSGGCSLGGGHGGGSCVGGSYVGGGGGSNHGGGGSCGGGDGSVSGGQGGGPAGRAELSMSPLTRGVYKLYCNKRLFGGFAKAGGIRGGVALSLPLRARLFSSRPFKEETPPRAGAFYVPHGSPVATQRAATVAGARKDGRGILSSYYVYQPTPNAPYPPYPTLPHPTPFTHPTLQPWLEHAKMEEVL